ncbi:MAG: hypothetical protein K2X87_10875 [Gemmataceae bacterium]|nr:hypothetical protein [Gemmataceae bacterium]
MLPLVLSLTLAATASHEAENPLYKSLLDPGLTVGPDLRVKLPPPVMPDGLDAAKQKAVIQQVIGADYDYAEFTRKSVVAPSLLRIRDVSPSDPKAPSRGVDVYFVAYGDLKATDDEKFLDRLVNTGKGEGKARGLNREELAKRQIGFKEGDEKKEGYGQVEFDFLEKVRLKITGHAMWSKTADSVVAAAEIDPRFRGDPEFPNEWRPIVAEGGAKKVGPPQPYGGGGMYLKITKLAEPGGALFVEQHIVFAEPTGWFDGANLLRSKLPLVVQSNVRDMRREWTKWSPGK